MENITLKRVSLDCWMYGIITVFVNKHSLLLTLINIIRFRNTIDNVSKGSMLIKFMEKENQYKMFLFSHSKFCIGTWWTQWTYTCTLRIMKRTQMNKLWLYKNIIINFFSWLVNLSVRFSHCVQAGAIIESSNRDGVHFIVAEV